MQRFFSPSTRLLLCIVHINCAWAVKQHLCWCGMMCVDFKSNCVNYESKTALHTQLPNLPKFHCAVNKHKSWQLPIIK